MNTRSISILLMGALLFHACEGRDTRKPPGREEVLAVRDSIRGELLLRIGRVQQEINRRVVAMNNQAYDARPATARRLRQKIREAESSYEKLEKQTLLLQQDSLMRDWIMLRQETELLITEAGRILETSF